MTKFKGGRIGFATVPLQRIEMTRDDELIQRATLRTMLVIKPRPFDRADVIVMIGGLAVLAALIVGWFYKY